MTFIVNKFRFIFGLAAVLFVNCAYLQAQEAPEYQVKAAFICNFAKFVEWPSNTFATADAPLVIGVFGDNPFNGYLDATAEKVKSINGHPLKVKKITFTADLKNCQIVFISSSLKKTADIPNLLKGLDGVLTVGEMDGFTRSGGIINFITEDSRVRFEINSTAANDAKLRISSKLLMLAKKPQARQANPDEDSLCAIFP